MSNSSIWPIDRTLSRATTSGQSESGSDGNEGGYFAFFKAPLTRALSLDGLMSYAEHLLGESYSSAEIQLIYSTASANWTVLTRVKTFNYTELE